MHNTNGCGPSISKSDIQSLYDRARSLYEANRGGKATVSVARVWNSDTNQAEDWVATHLSDLPASIKNNLNGARYIFGSGDAEATIVNELGNGNYSLLGIASSTRICPTCYRAIKGVSGMMETTVGQGTEDLPDYTEWRTAVNLIFWDGT